MNPALLKYAYALGIEKAANEAGLTKEAFVGKALWGLGKGIWNVAKPIGRFATKQIEKPIAGIGRGIGKRLMPYVPAGAKPWVGAATRGLPGQMASWGLLSGGLGAAMAPEGERLEAALRGLGTGALMGGGFGAAKGLTHLGLARRMKSVMGSKGMTTAARRARMPLLSTLAGKGVAGTKLAPSEMGKIVGAKTLLRGIPLGVGMGATMYMPSFEKHPWATAGGAGLTQAMMQGPAPSLPPSFMRRLPALGALGFTPQREWAY